MSTYDAEYYAGHLGYEYVRNDHWLTFFAAVADDIVKALKPTTVLDVGCALGFLVEQLRNKGVEAWGVDISTYAIENVHPSIEPYVAVSPILTPLPMAFPARFDVVTCIEVIEHLPREDSRKAVEWLCSLADVVVFTSTPRHYAEPSHIAVRPVEEWSVYFENAGFHRSFDVELESLEHLPWWAAVYVRGEASTTQLVRQYERVLGAEREERRAIREALITSDNLVSDLSRKLADLPGEVARLTTERDAARAERDALAADRQALIEATDRRVAELVASRTWKLGRVVTAPVDGVLRAAGMRPKQG